MSRVWFGKFGIFAARFWRGGVFACALATVSACSEHSAKPFSPGKVSSATESSAHGFAPKLNSTISKNQRALKAAFRPNSEFYRSEREIRDETSPRCRRILADSGVQTTILRSPTLSSEITDTKDVDLSLGYDFMNLKRANLTEEIALARCEQQALFVRLAQLLTTSEQSLSRAGYLAIADYLRDKREEFASIRVGTKKALEAGELTVQTATALEQYLDQIIAREAEARGEAARRQFIDKLHKGSFAGLDDQIVAVETRLADIERRRRTLNALSFSANANYGVNGDTQEGDATASVTMSVRLGAFTERRHNLEQVSEEARISAFDEEGSGAFWRSRQLRESIVASLASLDAQRKDIIRSIDKAKLNSQLDDLTDELELHLPQLRARIDILALTSRLRGVEASIVDIERLNNKLRFE